ncbi:hypothetical protein E8E13_003549 [Curvularia kusanoi]|uniref:Tyrosinase copper-binding domain-containing protein n=1 Tax=Curvularia kusanoi TaxID=90978 RepID=A0A9P4TAB7_CURKU|nr:hypothetical protein E8E13_003549 [Curvularia kusanoi]
MRFSPLFLSASLCAAATLPRQADNSCTNPAKRVEWRTLGADVQQQYIDAVLCLKTKPSGIGLNTTRYDDFAYVHTNLNQIIHTVAMFLPWHRLFVKIYEESLRSCGYTGSMPYWDWTLDTANVPDSPIWSTTTGFGGNGDPSVDPFTRDEYAKCVVEGPLKGLQVAYSMTGYEPHCLTRNFNNGTAFPGNMFADNYTPEVIEKTLALGNYPDFRYQLEGVPHGAIHSAVGGDMSPATSPNDPIFFLHHGQIDRLWTLWQLQKPETRTMEFGGPKTKAKDSPEATLEDVMPYMNLVPDIKVSEVMSTQSSQFCYVYI